ncbi:MAG TPA: hypothetical protein VN253_21510 [Kofleriaceae bacterium]|nr:hypothetical protein [Kofleriaceae bacterium]
MPLEALAEWQHLERLEVLDLSHCHLQARNVASLASFELPALRVLRLSGNPIAAEGAATIARWLPTLQALERLELADALIDAQGREMLNAAATRVRLVFDPPPVRFATIDAIGTELELARVNESEWAISFDGTRKPIRQRTRGSRGQAIDEVIECAMLGSAVRTLSTGMPRRLARDGVALQFGRYSDAQALLVVAPDHSEILFEPRMDR